MDKKTIRGLQILREELHLATVKKDFVGRLAEYFQDAAEDFRDEHDKSYLNRDNLKEISETAVNKYVQDVIDRKF